MKYRKENHLSKKILIWLLFFNFLIAGFPCYASQLCSELVSRNHQGQITRNAKARHEFIKIHPCPSTGKIKGACPGYIIDHIIPLKRGGPDTPANMQWQTREEAKAKDKWE